MPTYVFNGSDARTGSEPWLFDINLGGSQLVRDVAAGPSWGIDSSPAEFTRFGTGALFAGVGDVGGAELWFTDGTSNGTRLVADIAPGPRPSRPSSIVVSGDLAYFTATTYETGTELWVTDGTGSGTRIVADIVSGQSGSDPLNLQPFGSGVIFNTSSLGGLWFTDGEHVVNLTKGVDAVLYGQIATTNDLILFSTPLRHPSEVWISDGTPQGTNLLFGADNPFGIARISQVEASSSLVYFTAEAISGRTQLYVTDGTLIGTRRLVDDGVLLDSFPSLQATDNFVLYQDNTGVIWSLLLGATKPQKLLATDLFFGVEVENIGRLAFFTTGESGGYGSSLWVTDGTTAGTRLLLEGDFARFLAVQDDRILVGFYDSNKPYIAELDFNGSELSRTAAEYGSGPFTEIGGEVFGSQNNDVLRGGAGSDTLIGGIGNDIYHVNNAMDVVIENTNQGTDLVQSSVSFTLSANVENLTLLGPVAVAGTGNALANAINGNAGSNRLYGLGGNDTITGGAGNDTINGGAGVDRMTGGAGNDTYLVDNAGDVVLEYANQGADLVQSAVSYSLIANVENLSLIGSNGVSGTGNMLSNVINGNSGNNVLDGLAGNDTLNGGLGADRMNGGAGNDTYRVDNAGDLAIELAGEGIDLVQSSVNHTLRVNVENLTLLGTGQLTGTGNAAANLITGNAGNNRLSGLNGNDTINGGAGNDVINGGIGNDLLNGGIGNDRIIGSTGADRMAGGAGADSFVFTALSDSAVSTAGRDTISDFNRAQHDRIDLGAIDANARVAGNQAFRYLGDSAFTGQAGELSARNVSGGTLVSGDVNGDRIADFALLLDDRVSLGADSFIL